MTLTVGSQLGPYHVDALIGHGGMGEVYQARDTRLNRDVALKVLSSNQPTSAEHFERLSREARTGAILNHPNIVTVYDIGSHEGMPFVVSELLHGETLRARLRRGPLPPEKAVEFGRQVADGLLAAHRAGVVHRDLKPENIFVAEGNRVKILDFGLAKSRQEALELLQDSSTSTKPGTLFGTVGYMSPEQVRGLPLDERSDVFSLGVILYEMVSGEVPFRGDSSIETLYAILKDDPPPLAVEISPELERVIRHCLEKEPDVRFQSARDLMFNLDLLQQQAQSVQLRSRDRRSSRRWPSLGFLQSLLR